MSGLRVVRTFVIVVVFVAGLWAAPAGADTLSITGFSPESGDAGTVVTITGSGFSGTTAVKFNGVSASFVVNTAKRITTTVPTGATTGRIALTKLGVTRTTATDFVVGSAPPGAVSAWPTFQHDYRHTGKTDVNGPTGTAVAARWTYKSVSWIKNQVTIGPDKTVYAGDSKFPVCAIGSASGNRLWCTKVGGYVNQSAATVGNPYTKTDALGTRTVQTLYIGERNNVFWAIDTEGTVLWSYKINLDGDVRQTAVIGPDKTVYMMCGCTTKGVLHAFTPEGVLKWTLDLPQVRDASPALVTVGGRARLYVPTNNGELVAVDDLGGSAQIAWTEKLALANLHSSPSVAADGTIFLGTSEGVFAMRDNGASASVLPGWPVATTGDVDTTVAIGGAKVFASAFNAGVRTLYAIDVASASVLWQVAGPGSSSASFALTPSPVIGGNGWVYAAIGNDVYGFDPGSAQPSVPKWSYVTSGDVIALTVGDGVLYANTRRNKLYALGAS